MSAHSIVPTTCSGRSAAPHATVHAKKFCVVTTTPLIVDFFLGPHLKALSERFDVSLAFNAAEGMPSVIRDVPLEIIDVPMERRIASGRDVKALARLVREFRKRRMSGVVSIAPKAGLLAMSAAWLTRVPFRCHVFQGEVWATRTGLMRWVLRMADRFTARLATDILVVSESERAFLIREGIIPAAKSRVLSAGSIAGVDTGRFRADAGKRQAVRSRFGIGDDALVALFVGRLKRDKGVLDLAAAWRDLAVTYPQLHLLFVGPDEDCMQAPIAAACDPEVRQRLHFAPLTAEPEAFLAAADIFCLPSYREGFGCTVIEAGATGLPVLTSRIYGLQDATVEGATALMHEPGNVDDLRTKLQLLIEDAGLRTRLGAAGLARARERFEASEVVAHYIAYFEARLGPQS